MESDEMMDLFVDGKKKPFDPADPPHGSRSYDQDVLESTQKEVLNMKKLTQREDNEIYLREHPEIQGLLSLLLRFLLNKKPETGDHMEELVGSFFSRPRNIIAKELLDFLTEMNCSDSIISDLKAEAEIASGDSQNLCIFQIQSSE